jgi:anti-sigma B factor antagonist
MSIQSRILRDANGNIIVQMEGDLNYDIGAPLRSELLKLAEDNPTSSITVDLGGIDFVGASGISHFVETLKILKTKSKYELALSNVKTEFLRVFKLYDLNEQDVLIDMFDLDSEETSEMNMHFGNRSRTFEN